MSNDDFVIFATPLIRKKILKIPDSYVYRNVFKIGR